VIEIPGYTLEEKVEIGSRHLLPKQLTQHGLTSEQLRVPPQVLSAIAGSHTREAGVRNLERMIGAVCRAAAVKVYYVVCVLSRINAMARKIVCAHAEDAKFFIISNQLLLFFLDY
jgi:ATP-dependent Lon protease